VCDSSEAVYINLLFIQLLFLSLNTVFGKLADSLTDEWHVDSIVDRLVPNNGARVAISETMTYILVINNNQ
jgi:hypothetical protein